MITRLLRRGAVAATMTAIATTGVATSAAAATDSPAKEPVGVSKVDKREAGAADAGLPTLWHMRSTANGKALIHNAFPVDFVARTMPPELNPLYTGQLYEFVYHAQSDAYEVVGFNNGTCLDIEDGYSTTAGKRLAFRECDGTPSQLWESKINGAGWYLKNEWSGLYATQESFSDNSPIIQWQNLGLLRQRFHMPMYAG